MIEENDVWKWERRENGKNKVLQEKYEESEDQVMSTQKL